MKTKLILSALLFTPLYFFGWGAEGHKMVADIAQKNLNKGVEQQVQKYLGEMTFEKAATWMDEIRDDHSLDYMKPYHYLNVEKDATYVKSEKGDVVSELQVVIAELKNYKTMKSEDVNKDLKILFHLCGDISMPLHVGYGSDKGGNGFKVTCNGKETNLHHVWDSEIIKEENITTELCLIAQKKLTDAQNKMIYKMDVVAWMNDSRALLPKVYDIKDNAITKDYLDSNKEQVELQLAKGGLMLASVLNDIFK